MSTTTTADGGITVRAAVASDSEAISALVLSLTHVFFDQPDAPVPDAVQRSLSPDGCGERISASAYGNWVAERNGAVIGYAAVHERRHLYHLFVRESAQGQGIARALWQQVLAHCGAGPITVRSSRVAVPVYERFGFVLDGQATTRGGVTYQPMVLQPACQLGASPSTAEKALHFQAQHNARHTFVMANAWDAGSAAILEAGGIQAIGTTSAGVAFSRALPDYEGALGFDEALDATRCIVEAVSVPVSMDSENGYAHAPTAVHDNFLRIAETGVVGASLEDYTGDANDPHYDMALAVERVQAAKSALSSLGYPFVLTARSECLLTDAPGGITEAVARVNRYAEAGADCVFVPGIRDVDTVKTLMAEVDVPVSVLIGLSSEAFNVANLRSLGVARISIGGSLARASFGLVRRAAAEMVGSGSFSFAADQYPDAELSALFTDRLR